VNIVVGVTGAIAAALLGVAAGASHSPHDPADLMLALLGACLLLFGAHLMWRHPKARPRGR
jgi:uncharacterized membrane protein YeaQ/YmgE (transglycosylase-associated protein family)